MKPATLSDIKKALTTLNHKEISELCVRLASFKKENKELLTYLLFEADNQAMYIKNVKEEIDHHFSLMARNIYFAKKTIRKALRLTNNYIKFAANKQTEVELLIYFCQSMNRCGLPVHDHPVTENIYNRQVLKIEKALQKLHEDLQYDYGRDLEILKSYQEE